MTPFSHKLKSERTPVMGAEEMKRPVEKASLKPEIDAGYIFIF